MSGILRKYARYADTLYYLSFSLFTIFMTLSNSMLGQSVFFHGLLLAVKFLCLGLVCGKILLSGDFLKKSFLPAMLFMMLSVIVYLVMGDSLLMMLTFLTFGAYGCSHKRLAWLFLWCAGSVVLLCTLCATLGIVEDRIFYRHDSDTARHSMGMTYATIWSAMIFFLSAVYLYLRKKNIRLWELLLAALVSIGAYLLSQTRIELAASLVMVAAVLLFRYYRKAKITPWILSYSVIIACAVAFITVYLYIWDPETCAFLNRLLTGRLWYGSQGITQYGYSLFGQMIPMQGHGTIQSDPEIGYFFIDAF